MEKPIVLTVIKGVDQKGWAMVTLFSTTPNSTLWRVTQTATYTHLRGHDKSHHLRDQSLEAANHFV